MEIFNYIEGLENTFSEAYKIETDKEIKLYQGKKFSIDNGIIQWLQSHPELHAELLHSIEESLQTDKFRTYIVKSIIEFKEAEIVKYTNKAKSFPNTKGYILCLQATQQSLDHILALDSEATWEFIWENYFESSRWIYDSYRIDYRFKILEDAYSKYLKIQENQFDDGASSQLERYLESKGIHSDFATNYDLYKLRESDELRWGNPPKIYLPDIQTHLIVDLVPSEMMSILNELKSKYPHLTLSIRPDFKISGDGLKDIQTLKEALIQGRCFTNKLTDVIPGVTHLYNEKVYGNQLIIIKDEATPERPAEIKFEELIDTKMTYADLIMTQMIHLQFYNDDR